MGIETMEKERSPKEQAKENFNAWNEALQTKDATIVANMYTDDAIFLPTMSGELKSGKSGAREYFEHFLQKNPFGSIIEDQAHLSGDNIIHAGLYNFEIGHENDRSVVEGRFSFLWVKIGDEWKIEHHHSSLKPAS